MNKRQARKVAQRIASDVIMREMDMNPFLIKGEPEIEYEDEEKLVEQELRSIHVDLRKRSRQKIPRARANA